MSKRERQWVWGWALVVVLLVVGGPTAGWAATNTFPWPADGNVGIGTTAPAAKLAINGGVHVGGDSNPGDNNLLVDGKLSITGMSAFTGSIGLQGTAPVAAYGIYGNVSYTDPASGSALFNATAKPTYTGAGTVAGRFYNFIYGVSPIIAGAHTNSDAIYSLYISAYRNANGAAADDNGTLAVLYGGRINYGHYNTNASANPQTTTAYGLYVGPYQQRGNIANMYDIYLAAPVTTGGGTASLRYGIYQANTADNVFGGMINGSTAANGSLRLQGTTNATRTTSYVLLQPNGGNVGIGTTTPTAKLHVVGDAIVSGNIAAKYQDVAEWVPTKAKAALPPGTVVIIDPQATNQVLPAAQPYDTRVAGVVSARPGLLLGEEGEGKVKVAHAGRVAVKVDASYGPIAVGDLLVTSPTSGYAMRSTPVDLGGVQIHRPGTLVGKALEPLASGQGEILMLLTLQ